MQERTKDSGGDVHVECRVSQGAERSLCRLRDIEDGYAEKLDACKLAMDTRQRDMDTQREEIANQNRKIADLLARNMEMEGECMRLKDQGELLQQRLDNALAILRNLFNGYCRVMSKVEENGRELISIRDRLDGFLVFMRVGNIIGDLPDIYMDGMKRFRTAFIGTSGELPGQPIAQGFDEGPDSRAPSDHLSGMGLRSPHDTHTTQTLV